MIEYKITQAQIIAKWQELIHLPEAGGESVISAVRLARWVERTAGQDELARVRAENERLRTETEQLGDALDHRKARLETKRLRAENERLRAALKELITAADPQTNLSMIPLLDALGVARAELAGGE